MVVASLRGECWARNRISFGSISGMFRTTNQPPGGFSDSYSNVLVSISSYTAGVAPGPGLTGFWRDMVSNATRVLTSLKQPRVGPLLI